MWCVYIIRSIRQKWYYVGSTNRINKRLREHNSCQVRSTKYYAPFKIVYIKHFESEKDAKFYEKKIKKCRKEKESIIKEIEKRCGVV